MTAALKTSAPEGEWVIAKRRGNRVRYRHTGTLVWGGWEKLTPDHPEYRHPVIPATDVSGGMPTVPVDEPAPETKYAEMSRDELRKLAALRNIKGRGTMSKAELAAALANDDEKGAAPTY
ncbi:hypothetical protein SEA_DALANDE_79 [Gordonia phage DalanDe]|nr:hypothetical protein SEA_DALANDE_79 [Gordonia phage DalanDe]